MNSDSKCEHCNDGTMLEINLLTYDWDLLPNEIERQKLTRLLQCNKCGFAVFFIDKCDECSGEWECHGSGIANSDKLH